MKKDVTQDVQRYIKMEKKRRPTLRRFAASLEVSLGSLRCALRHGVRRRSAVSREKKMLKRKGLPAKATKCKTLSTRTAQRVCAVFVAKQKMLKKKRKEANYVPSGTNYPISHFLYRSNNIWR